MNEEKKAYDPKEAEARIYPEWEKSGLFNPDNHPKKDGKPFVILMPLPNVTGSLHMGHAFQITLTDALIRYRRMKGDTVAWLPGTDHAGIATQNVVEKELRKEGVSRFDLGREAFIARVWEWKEKYGGIIFGQLRTMGASCDWSRSRFTMDPAYAEAVMKAFVHYHEKGLLYRALRTVSWCVRCHTGISDLEVEHEEKDAVLYHIQYGPFVVATTRPETKFGDMALAVNPRDLRYADHIGKDVEIETLDTEGSLDEPRKKKDGLIVVGDEAADIAFGTGIIKVTPAHDIADYEISKRHSMPMLQVIDDRGKMMAVTGKYAGMKVAEARKKVVDDLRATGLLVKEEAYRHNVSVCSRCATPIEPLPSWQWFLKMGELAREAKDAVVTGKTRIIPENFQTTYFAWLENIRDWCVSRQLWWGHQLPVWFCENAQEEIRNSKKEIRNPNGDGRYVVALEKPGTCPFCKKCAMKRSEDVLDTWWSSALWPFAAMPEKDLERFYPSSVLITARDIINLWVGRMIFSGLEFKGAVPFPDVFIHATILTKDGRRMSKSLGTGIDPLTLVEKYGADALRFGIAWQAMGTQDVRWDETAVMAGKKFANKLWNAARFVAGRPGTGTAYDEAKLGSHDALVLQKLAAAKRAVEESLDKYEFGQAIHAAYDFFWKEYCDTYLEAAKAEPSSETDAVLRAVLRDSLMLLHPFMPFVTEAIWTDLPGTDGLLMGASW